MNAIIISYLCISEQEHSVFIFHSSKVIKFLYIIMESIIIIATAQFYLEAAIATYVSTQSERSKWLVLNKLIF